MDKRKVYSKLNIARKRGQLQDWGSESVLSIRRADWSKGKAATGKAAAATPVTQDGMFSALPAALYPVFSALKQNDV